MGGPKIGAPISGAPISITYHCMSFSLNCFKRTSGSAARYPSLYLALRARPWLRMSQSYDLSDVDTTLMLFAAATVCSRTQSWQWVSWNVASWTLAGDYCSCCLTVNICSPDTRPSPKTTVAYVCARAGWLRRRVSGKGANVEYQLRRRWGLQPRPT